MKRFVLFVGVMLCLMLALSACSGSSPAGNQQSSASSESLPPLPPAEPDIDHPFGVDVNINMDTIDDWLERPDVAYRDMRMFFDPAGFGAIGGISNLTQTLPGYLITPLPYIATLSAMPVEGAYDGDKLFDVVWGEDGGIVEIKANYEESETIINELFPKDKAIFLMCGGSGYSALTRVLLVHMGWDADLIYSTGGNWYYEGDKAIDLMIESDNVSDAFVLATWRTDYAFIDFDRLHPIAS